MIETPVGANRIAVYGVMRQALPSEERGTLLEAKDVKDRSIFSSMLNTVLPEAIAAYGSLLASSGLGDVDKLELLAAKDSYRIPWLCRKLLNGGAVVGAIVAYGKAVAKHALLEATALSLVHHGLKI